MTFTDILHLFIFFGGGLALLMALSHLLEKGKKDSQWLFILLYLCLSLIMLPQFYSLSVHNQPGDLPAFLLFLMGPLTYLYFQRLIDSEYKLNARKLLHFLPAMMKLAMKITTSTVLSHSLRDEYRELLMKIHAPFYIYIVGVFHILLYMLLTFWVLDLLPTLREKERKPLARISSLWLISSAIVLLIIIYSLFAESVPLFRLSFAALSLLVILTFLIGQKYPEFTQWFTTEVQKNRQGRSLIKDLDTQKLKKKLTKLMEEEKRFCDEDLTLNVLARELEITPHQLSEFLNRKLKLNFNSYINKYRIREAKELLITDEGRTITSICYAVGFNTKSVFNEAFLNHTGMSPREFRKNFNKI